MAARRIEGSGPSAQSRGPAFRRRTYAWLLPGSPEYASPLTQGAAKSLDNEEIVVGRRVTKYSPSCHAFQISPQWCGWLDDCTWQPARYLTPGLLAANVTTMLRASIVNCIVTCKF